MKSSTEPKPQLDKFKDLARELEADESEERFEKTVKRVAKKGLLKPRERD
jgi:hypothetical protein